MTDPHAEDGHHADPHWGDPVLWQLHELFPGPRTGLAAGSSAELATEPAPAARAPATDTPEDPAGDAERSGQTVKGPGAATGGSGMVAPVEVHLAPGSLPTGPGRVALPVAVLGPRELEPYLTHNRHGSDHRGRAVISVDQEGRPVRAAHGGWDYTAPCLRGTCRCGWTGPLHPQTPLPAQHDRAAVRDHAWREVNRAARRAIDLEWLDHIHVAVPSLGITVLRIQRDILDRALDDAVEHARLHGAPWQEVGDEAHMTRQSAHERWRHLDPPRAVETETPAAEKPSTQPTRTRRRIRHDNGAHRD